MKNQIRNYAETILYVSVTLGVFSMVGRLLIHIIFNDARMLIQTFSGAVSMLVVFAFLLFLMYRERKHYYKVRYAGKLIKVLSAHSKWEAIDRIYNDNIGRYKWIVREKFTAVKSK
jgi:hypothetical protein